MLEATDETDVVEAIIDSRLDCHEQRRHGGVPTVSVLAGPVDLAARLLAAGASVRGGHWCCSGRSGQAGASDHCWVNQLAAGCDLADAAAAWLTTRLSEDAQGFRFITPRQDSGRAGFVPRKRSPWFALSQAWKRSAAGS